MKRKFPQERSEGLGRALLPRPSKTSPEVLDTYYIYIYNIYNTYIYMYYIYIYTYIYIQKVFFVFTLCEKFPII